MIYFFISFFVFGKETPKYSEELATAPKPATCEWCFIYDFCYWLMMSVKPLPFLDFFFKSLIFLFLLIHKLLLWVMACWTPPVLWLVLFNPSHFPIEFVFNCSMKMHDDWHRRQFPLQCWFPVIIYCIELYNDSECETFHRAQGIPKSHWHDWWSLCDDVMCIVVDCQRMNIEFLSQTASLKPELSILL